MSHYFHTPAGPERRREVDVELWGETLRVTTSDGVFSGGGLDLGTSVLLREARPDPAAHRLLDLGCGWGPLAVALARALPEARVDAVDVNERALGLCRTNVAAHTGGNVSVLLPQEADPAARYDEIWSNPPIRIGKQALHQLLLTWLPRLADDGVAWLVVGRNLGADSLQRWLGEQGFDAERHASAKGFRVLAVRHGALGGPTTEAAVPPPGG